MRRIRPSAHMKLTIEERWHWWRVILGSPKYVCAPMVLQSELAFRMMVRRHGVGLCYTPMLPVTAFLAAPADGEDCEHPLTGGPCTQAAWFTTVPGEGPTLAQIGGSDPQECLAVAKRVQAFVQGVDVNFGCPQRCAEAGGYGAFLLDHPERARAIIETLVQGLDVPVTAKIRILPTLEATLRFAKMLEEAGVAALAVHGRLREARQHEGAADWAAIAAVKAALRIPIISNGNVRKKADADACMLETGCDAVMSATALLHNPRLFASAGGGSGGRGGDARVSDSFGDSGSGCMVRDGRPTALGRRSMALEYLECCRQYPDGALPRMISDHLLTILSVDLPSKSAKGKEGASAAAALSPQQVEEDSWRQSITKRCKAYKTSTRTPDQFEEFVVRALEAGPTRPSPAADASTQGGGEAGEKAGKRRVGRLPRVAAQKATMSDAAAGTIPSAPDEKAIKRAAVKRAAARRSARHALKTTTRGWWEWRGVRGSAVGVVALSAWCWWWLVLGPSLSS